MAVRSGKAAPRAVGAKRRRSAVRKASAEKVDALLISRPEDVSYLSGFSGDDSLLLLAGSWVCLLTDGRFGEQAGRESGEIDVHVRKAGMPEALAKLLKGRRVRRIGVQGGHMTVGQLDSFVKACPGKRFKPVADPVGSLRMVKDDAEVRAIRKAIAVGERAFKELLATGAGHWIGRSERDLAAELEYRMRLAGADGPAFGTILAAGAHGSNCHYRPDSTRVRANQPVLIDWGARVGGYCSDLTRVVFVGKIPPKLGEMYEVVRRAQAAAIGSIRPGRRGSAIDAVARKVIADAGYGEQFVHSLGHGLGRQVHEAPGLGRKVKSLLRAGMVVTVEPGIYVPGLGGIRIEDDVLVTPGGCRRLTSLPRTIDAMRL